MNYRETYKRTHNSWRGMRERCNNEKHIWYMNYGGRGIKVCKRWSSFKNFLKDMGQRPSNKTLDRLNNNRNYSKSNCKWSTITEQQNNVSTNKCFLYKDVWYTIAEGAKELKMHYRTLQSRIRNNWPNEIIDAPLGARKSDYIDADDEFFPEWVLS